MDAAGIPSAAELARKVGQLSESAVRHHANGTRAFGIHTAYRYGEVCHCSALWLFVGKDKLDTDMAEFIDMASQLSPAERQAVLHLIEIMRRGRAS